ncbi:MAG: D-alanyl-D-alanine carboxypeptidase family protein [Candidatus Peribacteria bacterium]|nr:MAG: D-alanyl-D-alanine carboxypeptidase family protein [Candidatus Peribacteria bacterium]
MKDRGCSDDLCAKAGYSEHQTGLAVDLWEASTDQEFLSQPKLQRYYDWLDTRAYLYGFTNTYQK